MKTTSVRLLEPDDWQALLAFELQNRTWFEQHIAPRSDLFYSEKGIQEHITSYLTDHAAGRWFPGLLLDAVGVIIGRANLKDVDVQAGVAELGYRVAQDQTGNGVATAAVAHMKDIAQQQCGLRILRAIVYAGNVASKRVLEKSGFVRQGTAPPGPEGRGALQVFTYECVLG